MPDQPAQPTDAFGDPIHIGDTVVMSAKSSTPSPGLIHAQVVGFTPSGALVDMEVTRVGREQGRAMNQIGARVRRETGRVHVLRNQGETDG